MTVRKTRFVQVPCWVQDHVSSGALHASSLHLYGVLCRFVDAESRDGAFPSVATMVERSGLSAATVGQALRELRSVGAIIGTERPGRTTMYFLPMDDPTVDPFAEVPPPNFVPPQEFDPPPPPNFDPPPPPKFRGGSISTELEPVTDTPPTPRRSRSGGQLALVAAPSAKGDGDGFDEFWSLYPRKVAKGRARAAFAKAVAAGVPAEEIIAGLRRGLPAMRERIEAGEVRYVKHPGTWLAAECWLDVPEASIGGKVTSLYQKTMEVLRMSGGEGG